MYRFQEVLASETTFGGPLRPPKTSNTQYSYYYRKPKGINWDEYKERVRELREKKEQGTADADELAELETKEAELAKKGMTAASAEAECMSEDKPLEATDAECMSEPPLAEPGERSMTFQTHACGASNANEALSLFVAARGGDAQAREDALNKIEAFVQSLV